ncbi:alpha/beta-hydrolase family protein [Prescottella defluvii]|uniref:alpha/beta hydrolase n=1 Tax=Prescottella defluvii TaxID=1323361 RepID=UPI0009DED3E3|nr:alpha/beta-hydrolase family protein [Prescottella defluvii]
MSLDTRPPGPGADTAADEPAAVPAVRRFGRRLRTHLRRLHPVGLAVALVFFTWSMSPSLLPRAWYLQGLATGISVALGYGVGCLAAWIVRACGVQPKWSARTRLIGWWILGGATAVVVPVFLVLGSVWQNFARELVGIAQDAPGNILLVFLIAVVVWFVLLEAGRGIRVGTRKLTSVARRLVPRPAANVAGLLVAVVIAVLVVNGALYKGLIAFANWSFSGADTATAAGVEEPTAPERSGSPASAQAWDTLGQEGRTFVGRGPNAERITEVTGRPAIEPIRVYAGRESAESIAGVADLVVAELDRTKAWERKVLAVNTTTGRGWVNQNVASSLEYIEAGDTAIASMQYSFLPSPLAFIADRETPQVAGRALFNAVFARWIDLPVETRPKLVVFGESLGSYGGQNAFAGYQDMATRVDGGLWVGTPNFTPQWREVTADRDAGSSEILPVVDEGRSVRFASEPGDLDLDTEWGPRRVVYWQHASDPIVWWSPSLLFNEPDWLREPRGRDVDPNMSWLPLVTFWQVTLDMIFSADVPAGHGHAYGPEAAGMWARILQPADWSDADTERVEAALTGG